MENEVVVRKVGGLDIRRLEMGMAALIANGLAIIMIMIIIIMIMIITITINIIINIMTTILTTITIITNMTPFPMTVRRVIHSNGYQSLRDQHSSVRIHDVSSSPSPSIYDKP